MANPEVESTNRLLRVMVALLLRQREEDATTLRQQIQVLDDLGLKSAEIAAILGRTSGYISKELSGIRKKPETKE